MKPDPVIDAVRKSRHEISELVDHDPQKLLEYYKRRQRERELILIERGERPAKDESAA